MYTRQEASRLRQEFWTAFGHYVAPLPSAEGLKINWINYKTGLPNVSFKMDAGTADAQIAIVLSHTDSDIRQLYFEQFMHIKHLLHDELGEEWQWEVSSKDEYDRPVSRIYKQLHNVNVFQKEDYPALISFFKQRIMALDSFWDTAKYVFDALR